MDEVAIALGSNLGDRRAHLAFAIDELRHDLHKLRVSTIIETSPVGVPDIQPPYLNAVVVGEYPKSARELFERLRAIEQAQGRQRRTPRAARTLDLDLILFSDEIIDMADLVVPHPRFRERQFVLEPLAEIAPALKDPVTGKRVDDLLKELGRGEA